MAVTGALVVGGLIAAGTAAASWMASNAASELDAETRARTAKAIKKYEDNYKLPAIDRSPLTAEEYKLIGSYAPSIAGFIEEKTPELITERESIDEKGLQKEALQKYQDLSETGEDSLAKAQREKMFAQAAGEERRKMDQLLKAYQQQGIGGGGQELLGSLAMGQNADANRRQASLDIAAQNQQRRNEALGKMAGLAGDVRRQNTGVEESNVSAINAFNERNARNRQNYEKYVADQLNEAQRMNLQAAQANADRNTGLRNQTNWANRDRIDEIERDSVDRRNQLNRDMLNASTGQAAMAREHGQSQIGRNLAMTNQAFQSVGNLYSGYQGAKAGAAADTRAQQQAADDTAYKNELLKIKKYQAGME